MKYFNTKDSSDSFEKWINKSFIPNHLKESLSNASILIIPFENLRDYKSPLFPINTEEIFRYFKEKLPPDILIDICIADEDYKEFAFNNDYKRLGMFLVKTVAIPMFLAILSSYVYDNYIKNDNSTPQIVIIDKSKNVIINNNISSLTEKKYLEPTNIMFTVTLIDTMGNSKEIHYEGPAKEIHTVLNALKEYEE